MTLVIILLVVIILLLLSRLPQPAQNCGGYQPYIKTDKNPPRTPPPGTSSHVQRSHYSRHDLPYTEINPPMTEVRPPKKEG